MDLRQLKTELDNMGSWSYRFDLRAEAEAAAKPNYRDMQSRPDKADPDQLFEAPVTSTPLTTAYRAARASGVLDPAKHLVAWVQLTEQVAAGA
jgi:hypothetical protein